MRTSRRRFLIGAGGAVVALPLLPSLLPSIARAGGETYPMRFVAVYTGNGVHPDALDIRGGERDFVLDGTMLADLAPLRSKVQILRGVRGSDGHYHGHAEFLTAAPPDSESFVPTGPSIDQLLANVHVRATPIASLELGVDLDNNAACVVSYSESVLPIPAVQNPRQAFERIFLAANTDPAALERLRAQKRSVLDSVLADVTSLQSTLSMRERLILDQHLTLLREQETRLSEPAMARSCELPPAPPIVADGDYPDDQAVSHHIDTIVAAFRCDVTRVATLMIGGSGATTRHPWIGIDEDYHQIAHGDAADAVTKHVAINRWQGAQVAALMARLDAIPEGDGTVLDHTIVLWAPELGTSTFNHTRTDVPVVLGGGLGVLASGQSLDMAGAHYHDVLLTVARAAGLSITELGREGRNELTRLLA